MISKKENKNAVKTTIPSSYPMILPMCGKKMAKIMQTANTIRFSTTTCFQLKEEEKRKINGGSDNGDAGDNNDDQDSERKENYEDRV